MTRIQVHPDRSTPPVCRDLHLRQFRGGEYPPTFRITLETVADSLAERGNSRLLLTMLPSVHRVLRVAPQRRQHHIVSRSKPHVWNHQVFAVPSRQAIRHRNRSVTAVVIDGRHAQLATSRLIPAPQHEELVAAGSTPLFKPCIMTGIAIGLQVILLPPQLLGAEAQPHPANPNVGFQPRPPEPQVGQPPPLPVHLPPLALLFSLINLLASTVAVPKYASNWTT